MPSVRLGYVTKPEDNVAVALADLPAGQVDLGGACAGQRMELLETVPKGHKFALGTIRSGDAVIKYGVRIGTATREIRVGEHVHLHNMKSDFDSYAESLNPDTALSAQIEYKVY